MKKILSIIILLIASYIQSEEGMYLLNQIPIKKLQNMGLNLSLEEIHSTNKASISDAVVNVGAGSGAFVSPDGLILTNHHVAFEAIQKASSTSNDYIKDGFYAENRFKEIEAKGYEARITIDFFEVTDDVLADTSLDMDSDKRLDKIKQNIKNIEKKIKIEKKVDKAKIISMFADKIYYIFLYKVIKDVRIVYAPPSAIGNYGGDIDNWMWTRHAGDFAFLRAYVSKDGKSVKYSNENIPYNPKKYAKITLAGVKEGDLTFIMGYPGSTMRYRSSYSANFNEKYVYPINIELFQRLISGYEYFTKKDRNSYIKYAFKLAMLNNVYKNYQGMRDGFKSLKIVEEKRRFDEKVINFIKKHPILEKNYGHVIDDIGKLYKELEQEDKKNTILRFLKYNVLIFKNALKLYEWSIEKEKKDRKPGFSDEDIKKLKEHSKIEYKNVLLNIDKKIMKLFIEKFLELPETEQFEIIKNIYKDKEENALDIFLDNLYENTLVKEHKNFIKMLDVPQEELLKDPAIVFAKGFIDYIKKIDKIYKNFNDNIVSLRLKYIEMIAIYKKYKDCKELPDISIMQNAVRELYPDANFTIRFTYGTIKGYSPRDAVNYDYITKLQGIFEKDKGKEPFNAPKKLYDIVDVEKYVDPLIGDVPVNFIHTTDITGGNSGSPVFNSNGEYIGIAFDGNYEAMTSDWNFNTKLTRTISCDVRYIIFLLDKFSNAKSLLKELGF